MVSSRAVKVLLVSPTGQLSGAEVVLLRAAAAMDQRGWEVITASPVGSLSKRMLALGIPHRTIPDLKLPAGHRLAATVLLGLRNVVASIELHRLGRDADLIFVNGFFALPALRLSCTTTPVAWLVHDVFHRVSWMRLLRLTGGAVSLAIAVSEAVAQPLRKQGLPVIVLPNGTPWPVEPTPERPSGPPVVGCAAMLTSWKGQSVLLDAVARLDRADVIVELAGGHFPKDGAYVARLQQRASRPDLFDRVRLLGPVADSVGRMRSWTVAVLASVDPEASPLAILEAMSLGVPVVASNHGGPPEMVGDAGLLVIPGDPADLARAIDRLLTDSDLWQQCHEAGPRRIEAYYVLDTQVQRLLDDVEELAGRAATQTR